MTDKIDKSHKPRISPRSKGFLDEMRAASPAGAEILDRNAAKANIAMAARGMRVASQLTQAELAKQSGLTQAVISRIETPSGSMPALETLMKYVAGLGGHLELEFKRETTPPKSGMIAEMVKRLAEREAAQLARDAVKQSRQKAIKEARRREDSMVRLADENSSNNDPAIARLV